MVSLALRVGHRFGTETVKVPDLPALLRLSEGPTPLGQHVSDVVLLFTQHAAAFSWCRPFPTMSLPVMFSPWDLDLLNPPTLHKSSVEDISLPKAISCPTLISSEDLINTEIILLISLWNVLLSLSSWLSLSPGRNQGPLLPYCPCSLRPDTQWV